MNVYLIIALCFVLIYAVFLYWGITWGDKHDKDSIRGYSIMLSFCALMILFFIVLGVKDKYETHMINGSYEIGYDQEIKVINGDTTIIKSEPYIILKK